MAQQIFTFFPLSDEVSVARGEYSWAENFCMVSWVSLELLYAPSKKGSKTGFPACEGLFGTSAIVSIVTTHFFEPCFRRKYQLMFPAKPGLMFSGGLKYSIRKDEYSL